MANDHRLNLEENSKYRVAYDLMEKVALREKPNFQGDDDARKYFFDLYQQSFRVVCYNENYDTVTTKKKEGNISMSAMSW